MRPLNILMFFIFAIASYVDKVDASIISSALYSQLDSSSMVKDTIQIDTSTILPTIHNINNYHGSLIVPYNSISFHDIPTINYFTPTDIITQSISTFPLNTGIIGNNSSFMYLGALPNENGLFINNVSMFDIYGMGNLNALSPEFSKNIEINFGSKSAIFSGKSGSTINFQTPLYNTKKPYTRIWYTQGDNKLIGVDATYSQNFLPNWNITAGFRRLSAENYYNNSSFDSWNTRLMLRKNISDFSSISLLYHFSNYQTGDFGGIYFPDYNTNNNQANLIRTNFSGLKERQYKNDIIFIFSKNNSDSNFITNTNLFFNTEENNLIFQNQKELLLIDSTGKNISNWNNFGINTHIKYIISKIISMNFGGELSYNSLPNSIITTEYSGLGYNLFVNGDFTINSLIFSAGARIANKYSKPLFSFGGNITNNFSEHSSIFLDFTFNNSEPLPIFDYKTEKHLLGILGGKHTNDNFSIETNIFYRNIKNPILLQFDENNIYTFTPSLINISYNNIYGISVNSSFYIMKHFECSLNIQCYNEENFLQEDNVFQPKLLVSGMVKYNYIKGTSNVSGGLKATFLLNSKELYYNPIFHHYAPTKIENSNISDGLEVFLSAKFGNAFVRASMKNIIGTNFSYLAFYPIQKREICLSLTWAFPL
jgi:hypothetical protein